MFRKILVAHALICFPFLLTAQKTVELSSPSGKLKTTISIGNTIQYSVSHGGDLMLADSHIALTLADGTEWGINPRLNKQAKRTVRGVIPSPFYKKSEVAEHYHELKLSFKGNYNLVFRAYDEGIAYRFENTRNKPFVVKNEQAEFNFPADNTAYIPYANATGTFERQFFNSFENTYHVALLSQWKKERLGILPLLVEGA
ncbi:MAG: glycoside hydrolase family 97 N-terminal domain-containing protein, partial [Candidatus Symbiothrix sp.]|nr:glycoside hydrolase family 97 N-terminal domain-containing protein [Candidatus Symbiothrix sp.]